jgi:hypothetical protein
MGFFGVYGKEVGLGYIGGLGTRSLHEMAIQCYFSAPQKAKNF